MKIPDELNDPNTWGVAREGAVAYVRGNVWLKTADGWRLLSSSGVNKLVKPEHDQVFIDEARFFQRPELK